MAVPPVRIAQLTKIVPRPGEVVTSALTRLQDSWMGVLNGVLQLGTALIQGKPVPAPADQNDGQALTWSKVARSFVYASLQTIAFPLIVALGGTGAVSFTQNALIVGNGVNPLSATPAPASSGDSPVWNGAAWTMAPSTTSGATGGPTGSSTVVPVITYINGLLTLVGTATITGTTPAPTRVGQFLVSENGSTFVPISYSNQFDVPPASSSANDDEFEAAAVNTGLWTIDATTVEGTVNYLAALGVSALVDQGSLRGSLQIQNLNDATPRGLKANDISALYATGTNSDVIAWCKFVSGGDGTTSATTMFTGSNAEILMRITDNAGTTWTQLGLITNGTIRSIQYLDSAGNNFQRALTANAGSNVAAPMPVYVALWRHWNGTHHQWASFFSLNGQTWSNIGGPNTTVGSGVTPINVDFTEKFVTIRAQNSSATNVPQSICSCDFIRFKATNTPTVVFLPLGG